MRIFPYLAGSPRFRSSLTIQRKYFPEQSAALRNALLLEERGLQLERAEVLLRQKTQEETALRKELHRLSAASVTGKVRVLFDIKYGSRKGYVPRELSSRKVGM